MAGELISLDGAGEVVVKLLDMLERATVWLASPHGGRKDFAEGLATYKKAIEDDPRLTGLEKGAKIARARQDFREYINKGKIIKYAADELREDAPMNVSDDWLVYFFEYAKHISDDAIQKMWGRILAERLNGDTSVHRHLIHIMSLMDYETADAFTKLCKITVHFPKTVIAGFTNRAIPQYYPIVLNRKAHGVLLLSPQTEKVATEYIACVPSPEIISVLQEVGLIEYSEQDAKPYLYPYSAGLVNKDYSGPGNKYQCTRIGEFIIEYHGDSYAIRPKNNWAEWMGKTVPENILREGEITFPENIQVGIIKFTTVGEKLYTLIDQEPIPNFVSILDFYFSSQNFTIQKINDQKC